MVVASTLSVQDPVTTNYMVVPNPNNGSFIIKGNPDVESVVCTDISGKTIRLQWEYDGHDCLVNIADPAPGLYFLNVEIEGGSVVYKLIIHE